MQVEIKECKTCGKTLHKPPKYSYVQWAKREYCSMRCKGIMLKPTALTHWKGGERLEGGYWWVYCPDHPKAVKQYVKKATLVLEYKLKRHLNPNEIVHHINGIKSDDKPENLVVMDNREHSKYHALMCGFGKDKKVYRQRNSMGQFIGSLNAI